MRKLSTLLMTATAAALAACGGGSDDTLVTPPGPGGGGGGGGGGIGTPVATLGSGLGANFQPGALQLGVANLSAGGSTGVTATLVTPTGSLYTGEVAVTFNSPCVAQGLATITTPVDTNTGIANATYSASGCSGTDVITATTTIDGVTMTATGSLTVAAASVGSIQFISATPESISLKGTGGAGRSETSTVVFRVVDSTGGPVPNADVTFALNTSIGGVTVSPAPGDPPATTNFDGRVQAVVQAGTVATPLRVTATVTSTSPPISTQSDQLAISTGLPDQDSVSLSIETLNPEGWSIDGTTVPVTVRMSDRFNNPVPDGTAVTLWAEGGQIGPQCLTVDGACSVNWVSQSPRPLGDGVTDRAGRVTILATAIGEESFIDANGNGVYDGAPEPFVDLPEPWRDDNENGMRDTSPLEPFYDFDSDNEYDDPNGRFDGLLCNAPAAECGETTTAVFDLGVIVMSGCDVDPAGLTLSGGLGGQFGGLFADTRGNPLPAGTTIAFEATNGELEGPSSFTYPSTTEPVEFSVIVAADNTPSAGSLFVTVACPSGVQVTFSGSVTD